METTEENDIVMAQEEYNDEDEDLLSEELLDMHEVPNVGQNWRRSASFILDKHQNNKPISLTPSIDSLPPPSASMANESPNLNPVSAYYQTRAAHHGIVTSDCLEQAQAAVRRYPNQDYPVSERPFSVIEEFNNWRKQPDLAEAVAAIRALAAVIRASEVTTMMELEIELKKASDTLKAWDTTSISLTAGCDLFMRYVTRTSALEFEDFKSAKSRVLGRAEKFGEISNKARKIIAMLSQDFIFDGCTILVHGFSRVVFEVLKTAAQNKLFRVLCTEGRPDKTGVLLAKELAKLDVPVKLLIDSAVAYCMDEVEMVFVGADGVVESGGVINMMGTYQIAIVAHSMNKPVSKLLQKHCDSSSNILFFLQFARLYPLDQKDIEPALRPVNFGVSVPPKVEVERSARDYTPPQFLTLLFTDLGVLTPSVFARLYPLDQKDIEPALRPVNFGVSVPPKVEVERSARDYTPPHFLTLLFTDLGVLTPSVVSDELIQLYS
ncbi:unnamed protein product [Eruca vesicaria subsp. sativa]|uniref:Translation initiation factor eIF2B subunit alpha n=1 Tax=Eruca vesicaria subsp. sativa TaxID=29727 RepID=A0ABC8LF67_ERUVS|nr:unnamed protein product [Eruca vesicaria subsp. sativa]